jgi:hypothetical protein
MVGTLYGAALAGDRCEDASEIGEAARPDALGELRVDIGEDPKCDTVRLVAVRRQGHRSDEVTEQTRGLMAAADQLDVDEFVSYFRPDADFHNPIGIVRHGRGDIRELHEKLYSSQPPPGFPTFAAARSTGGRPLRAADR